MIPLPRKIAFLSLALLIGLVSWACSPLQQSSLPDTKDASLIAGKTCPLPPGAAKNDTEPGSPELVAEEDTPADNAEELTQSELDETASQEAKDLESLGRWEPEALDRLLDDGVTYDFPITRNPQVEYYIDFFQNKYRDHFSRWLARSSRYLPMIKGHLAEAGLPLDLAYLPLIESGFSLTAYSSMKAVGLWQFIQPTAIDYGLEVNNYVDERRDPIRATQAAVAYLKELYSQFGSWYLAVAAYNAGEGKMQRTIDKCGTKDFWKIANEPYLATETKRYVPKLIAAIIIAKSPEKYGFGGVAYEPTLAFDTTDVPRWTSLQAVAVALGRDPEEIAALNRHLRKGITPPEPSRSSIRIPAGTAPVLAKNLPRVQAITSTDYKTHVVKDKETIDKLCSLYDISKTTLLKANNLRKSKLAAGQHLRIPIQETTFKLRSESEMSLASMTEKGNRGGDSIRHTIKDGETVYRIAKRYGVTPEMIAAWNGLGNAHRLKIGQVLEIRTSSQEEVTQKIEVAREAARAADKSIKTAQAAPKPSQESKPALKSLQAGKKTKKQAYYLVQGGDTLWTIARQFNLSPDDLKKWNKLKDNNIYPGLRLLIKDDKELDA